MHTYCSTEGKQFTTSDGRIIVSPPCNSPRCHRCGQYVRLRKFWRLPTTEPIVACDYFAVLPYYSYSCFTRRSEVHEYFLRHLRGKPPLEIAYSYTLERQNNLHHANWLIFSDEPLQATDIANCWHEAIKRQGVSRQTVDIRVESMFSVEGAGKYSFKLGRNDTNYMPLKLSAKRVICFSRNFDKWVKARSVYAKLEAMGLGGG